MHAELTLSASTLLSFALVLARIAGVFVFIPIPGQNTGPGTARIVLALSVTMALLPRWPSLAGAEPDVAAIVSSMLSELALGTCMGLMVSFISEALTLGAQVLGLEAGYGYASVVDPTTQADSDVLPVFAQITAGLLFFTTGLHRYIISVFAMSLDSYPPGHYALGRNLANTVIELGSSVFSIGLRLALPVMGVLLMTDFALALLGRLNSQLHMGMHAFPAKMLLTLAMLAAILAAAPVLYQSLAENVFQTIRHMLSR